MRICATRILDALFASLGSATLSKKIEMTNREK